MQSRLSVVSAAAMTMFLGLYGLAHADVLTQRNDNARTGTNTGETVLNTSNVRPDTFGKLWTLYADGQVVAQPLYIENLDVDTRANRATPPLDGTFDAVLVATMHNTVYLYAANQENRLPDGKTKPLWATWLGNPRPGDKDKIDMWSTNDPEWGVLGTPVIDAAKTTAWVVAWHNDNGLYRYKLHALDLKSGAHRVPAIVIGGAPISNQNPCAYEGGFNPCSQKQRPGLLLSKGTLFIAFGGDGNRGNVFAYDATTLKQVAFWSSTPTGANGGIWQSGQGLAADDDGNLFFITGNGTFDADRGGKNYGDSFVKVALENGNLAVKDYFTPCDQAFLDGIDLDFGAGGAVLLPGTTLALGGGKEGVIYLLSRGNLGKYVTGPGGTGCKNTNVVQSFQATDIHVHGAGTTYGHIHSSPVFWKGPDKSWTYVWGENDRLKAFAFAGGKFTAVNQPVKSIFQPPMGMPGGMMSVSSNGTKAGSGIVWAVVPLNGDANRFRGVQGVVLALDAQDVSRQLWTSELAGPRDRLGLFAKYVPPTVAGGKVFVATYGDQEPLVNYAGNNRPNQFPNYYVAVYGLLPAKQNPKPIVNQATDDVTVSKAAAATAIHIDTNTCDPATAGNVDCTAAMAHLAGLPAFQTVVVPAGYNFAGCTLLTVTTASKQSGLANATGIGWYAADAVAGSQAMTSGRFIRTAELVSAGTAVFKTGAPAIFHRFAAVANCSVGQGSYAKLFKPFMQFEDSPDGNIYRNWDTSANYAITRAAPQFDRTANVVGP
jgi:hypothetical protein